MLKNFLALLMEIVENKNSVLRHAYQSHWTVERNYCDKFRIIYIPFYILKKISRGNCSRCWQSYDKNRAAKNSTYGSSS